MAGVEFKGLDQLKKDYAELETRIGMNVVIPAEDAAAKVFVEAIKSAVPHNTGQLESAVTIVQSKDRNKLIESGRRGLYVGIEKKRGYYGFFLEKGWTAMGRAGSKKRKATKTTHGQSGVEGGRLVQGTRWFSNAVSSAMQAAYSAYESKFNDGIKKIAG